MLLLLSLACRPSTEPLASLDDVLFIDLSEVELARIASLTGPPALAPAPTNAVADDPAAAKLGQWLYFDARFSGDGTVACATCHDPEKGFSDGLVLSEGLDTTTRHAPTVLNAAHNRWFFWDGRCDSLWCQATQPWEAPGEHGGSRLQYAHIVDGDSALAAAYEGVFGALPDLSDGDRFPAEGRPTDDEDDPLGVAWGGMTPEDQVAINTVYANLTKAIAAYERLLVTGPSAFDRFAEGLEESDPDKVAALDEAAQRGLKLFINDNPANPYNDEVEYPGAECYACHGGQTLSDLEFHNIGLGAREWITWEDLGRYEGVDKVLEDPFNGWGDYSDAPDDPANDKLVYLREPTSNELGQFKTASLRDVARHPPYMHGGHLASLEEVVDYYSDLDESPVISHRDEQLYPLEMTEQDRADLVSFLEALNGELPEAALLSAPDAPY